MELINIDLVKMLVKKQFPNWADLEIKAVSNMGHDNRTFHLGEDMSIRLPSGKDYALQAEKEQKWIPKLKEELKVKIPEIIAKGDKGDEFPYVWSICSWIEGDIAKREKISNMNEFAKDLAGFLVELQAIDCSEGPIAGKHNFYRGGDIVVYNDEYMWLVNELEDYLNIEKELLDEIWELALNSKWKKNNVWVHGDMAPTNILVLNGKLEAVIDFGILGVGDPACDLAMYWTFFKGEEREVFKNILDLDKETWNRARGWVLWKALYDINYYKDSDIVKCNYAKEIFNEVIEEYTNLINN